MKTYTMRHVAHQDVIKWEALGWQFVDFLPPPLCNVAQLYGWPYDSEPKFPTDLSTDLSISTNSGESGSRSCEQLSSEPSHN